MTIHAAKGLQFPVVILPRLDRGGQTDREPFIDEVFGIGFSLLKPDEGYRKTEPAIVPHMKNRSGEKEIAEKNGCFTLERHAPKIGSSYLGLSQTTVEHNKCSDGSTNTSVLMRQSTR